MKLESVLFQLREAKKIAEDDPEMGHLMADKALLEFINHPEVTKEYDEVVKWYA